MHALRAAVEAAARLLDRHEQQVAVDRHVALSAGTDDRREQLRLLRRLDVVGVEAVEVADEDERAAEREIGVGEIQRRRRPGRRRWAGDGRCRARRWVVRGRPAFRAASGLRPAAPDRKSPSGFGRLATSSMLRAACPASRRPAFSPTRGSGDGCCAAPIASQAQDGRPNRQQANDHPTSFLILLQHAAHAIDLHALIGVDVRRKRENIRLLPGAWRGKQLLAP